MSQSSSPLAPFLSKLEIAAKLSAADRSAVLGLPHTVRSFQPNTYLYREGDRPGHCFAIVNGVAAGQKIVRSGNRQIVDIHLRGDTVDLGNVMIGVTNHGVQAITLVQAALIPIPAIAALIEAYPALARAIWIQTLIHASIQREWTANVGRRDARTRIAHLLCEIGLRQEEVGVGPRDNYDLPLTQEQLADATGLTAVHVNRVISALRSDGTLGGRQRQVLVPDWDRLASVGDFRTNYLRCDITPAD